MTRPQDAERHTTGFDNRELIEQVRKVNKTLSIFAFVLQEGEVIPRDSQRDIADVLVALASAVRERISWQVDSPEIDAGIGRQG